MTRNASISESFFHLTRYINSNTQGPNAEGERFVETILKAADFQQVHNKRNHNKLPSRFVILSYISVVIAPRLRCFLDRLAYTYRVNRYNNSYSNTIPDEQSTVNILVKRLKEVLHNLRQLLHTTVEHFLIRIWPVWTTLYDALSLWLLLLYLVNNERWPHSSPTLKVLGLVLRRKLSNDDAGLDGELNTKTGYRYFLVKSLSVITIGALWVLRAAEFYLQNESRLRPSNPTSVIINPPPPPVINTNIPVDPSICPLCRKERYQPAASAGGIVFCLDCLVRSVRTYKKCPISGIATSESQVRRLFLQAE